VGAPSRSDDFIDIYGTTHRLVSGAGADLVHQQLTGSGPLLPHQIVGGTAGSEKTQYVTAALVRHIGGSMAARAAAAVNGHQLSDSWDVVQGLTGENTPISGVREIGTGATSGVYGHGVVRPNDVTAASIGSMTIYGTAVTLDGDRSLRSSAAVSSRLTTRVYPPMADYSVGGCNGGSSTLYGRLECGCCETYSSATVSPTSRSPALSHKFRHAATLATFDSSRRQNRRNLVASNGNGNHSRGDVNSEFDLEELRRMRREAVDDSTNANNSSIPCDVLDDSSADQHQRLTPESRDRPSVAGSTSMIVKSQHTGCFVRSVRDLSRAEIDGSRDGGTNVAELQNVTGNATIQPPSYIVPELLTDCSHHGSGRIQRDVDTP